MRVALLARCDDRGIATITHEFFNHMRPAKTLVMSMNDPKFQDHPERYMADEEREVRHVDMNRSMMFPELEPIDWLLTDVDVLFAHETLMDWHSVMATAHANGVRVVVQCNPELYCHHWDANLPHPDQWCWPTPWMLDRIHPEGQGPIVPVPVCDGAERSAGLAQADGPLRVLHVAGHAAIGDRNGTVEFMDSLGHIEADVEVTVIGQDGWLPKPSGRSNVNLKMVTSGVADRWDMYRGQHLVVLPRHYGGLCLPALEAMASGCAVAMTGCDPNTIWPVHLMRARPHRAQRTKWGQIRCHSVDPKIIAATIDRLAGDRDEVAALQDASIAWAAENTWTALRPRYDETLSS